MRFFASNSVAKHDANNNLQHQADPHRRIPHPDLDQHQCLDVLPRSKRRQQAVRCQRTSRTHPSDGLPHRLWLRLQAVGSVVRGVRAVANPAAQSLPRQILADSVRAVQELRDVRGFQDSWWVVDGRWLCDAGCTR
jgi:hypothetical protein